MEKENQQLLFTQSNMKRNLFFIGDIHGAFDVLDVNVTNSDIIQVGDFNIGLNRLLDQYNSLGYINTKLKSKDNHVYVVRGNHDNPYFFFGAEQTKEYYNKPEVNHIIDDILSLSNIHFVDDYTVLKLSGKHILCCGGAVSIDRRVLPFSKWFIDEKFVLNEDKLQSVINIYDKIDVVVTHNAPIDCTPIGFNHLVYHYAKNDSTLLDDLSRERGLISEFQYKLFKKFKPTHWFYGHFHFSHVEYRNNIQFRLLSINEVYELR